ncbi:hypothetical protein, partial [Salmonella enterica]
AMERVFVRPLSDLFRGELRCGDRETIQSALDALEEDIAELPPPDYTGLVEPAKPVQTGLAEVQEKEAAPEPASEHKPVLPM